MPKSLWNRALAYPGAEVIVGTDLAGTIVVLKVQE